MAADVTHQEDRGRFVVELDDGEEAYLDYQERDDGTLDYAHTFVPESHRGEGLAGRIVLEALAYARDRGLQIVPSCPYVRHMVEEKHPEYLGLVAPDAEVEDEDDGA
jgi:predicted GNAT family acetyltransferase